MIFKKVSHFLIFQLVLVCLIIKHTTAQVDESDIDNEIPDELDDSSFNQNFATYQLVRYQPRHVHISYSNDPTEMYVTWSTIDNPNSTTVEYGEQSLAEFKENGTTTYFEDVGKMHLSQYIHRVTLKNLVPGERYIYHCGGDGGWSDIFYFTAMQNGTDWSPKFAVYGDMGNDNAQSLTRLQREVQMGQYDAIIHVGDFAYDMDSHNGLVGDFFMEQIQSVAAYVPYMTCPGNHEERNNFHHYKNRFTMPGKYSSMMYSWNIGPIHFISISTEFYYYLQYGLKPVVEQYEWLEKDLQEATKTENRAMRPWIILYGHRPMYCSNNDTDDCRHFNSRTRVGIPYLNIFGLEDLLMKYGVDLALWAHEHSYERMYPVYNYTVVNSTDSTDPYKNPKAVVHITTGSAGCSEDHTNFTNDKPEWTAFRNNDYGYSRLTPMNKTHLYFEQVSDDQNGKIVDFFFIVRDHHKAYEIPNSD